MFPDLSSFEATRETLHWYSKVVSTIPRVHAIPHEKLWHFSLAVVPDGLVTQSMLLPENAGIFHIKLNLITHTVDLVTSTGVTRQFDMNAGKTATGFGDDILEAMADLGLSGDYPRQKFENEEARLYDKAEASKYLAALVQVDHLFKQHQANKGGDFGPVQLWSGHFDLATETFGTRSVDYEENGEVTSYPSQLNLGFSAGDDSHPAPYFYSNPFPFEADVLLDAKLPASAQWHTDGWKGSILEYDSLVGVENAGKKLLAYASAVYDTAMPTLNKQD